MTEEELEQKAEEWIKKNYCENKWTIYHIHNCVNCLTQKTITPCPFVLERIKLKQAYKDGYEQGQESMMFDFAIKDRQTLLKEIEELKWEQKQILEDNENYQKENEELKAQIKDLCSSLDIMNNRESELLAQIEKMKRCSTCKHKYKDTCYIKLMNNIECHNKDKWELAE